MEQFQKFHEFSVSALQSYLRQGQIDRANLFMKHRPKKDIECALISAVIEQMPDVVDFLCTNLDHEQLECFVRNDGVLLLLAVKGGNLGIIDQLIDVGAVINQPFKSGLTPLAESKNGQVAQFLIERGADVNQVTTSNNVTEKQLIHILMQRPLSDSCTLEIVEVLLQNGASASGLSCSGKTPLMVAATRDGSEDMLQILLDYGADLLERDASGDTALMHAVQGCMSFKNVSFFIRYNKDKTDLLNIQNHSGETPLMRAANSVNFYMIKKLVRHGADVSIRDKLGHSALLHALFTFNLPIVRFLINAGSDLNCQNNAGLSPLQFALDSRDTELLSLLFDSGADFSAVPINYRNTESSCLLKISVLGEEDKSCLIFLLDKCDRFHYMCPLVLLSMIMHNYTEMIPQLLRRGSVPADIYSNDIPICILNICPIFFVSPLCMALLVGNVALARYFMGNMFLTKSDLSSLTRCKILPFILDAMYQDESLDFLNEIKRQPFSLYTISLVTVSSAVGTLPGRENRVNRLSLPQSVKDDLLFKTQYVRIPLPDPDRDTVRRHSCVQLDY